MNTALRNECHMEDLEWGLRHLIEEAERRIRKAEEAIAAGDFVAAVDQMHAGGNGLLEATL